MNKKSRPTVPSNRYPLKVMLRLISERYEVPTSDAATAIAEALLADTSIPVWDQIRNNYRSPDALDSPKYRTLSDPERAERLRKWLDAWQGKSGACHGPNNELRTDAALADDWMRAAGYERRQTFDFGELISRPEPLTGDCAQRIDSAVRARGYVLTDETKQQFMLALGTALNRYIDAWQYAESIPKTDVAQTITGNLCKQAESLYCSIHELLESDEIPSGMLSEFGFQAERVNLSLHQLHDQLWQFSIIGREIESRLEGGANGRPSEEQQRVAFVRDIIGAVEGAGLPAATTRGNLLVGEVVPAMLKQAAAETGRPQSGAASAYRLVRKAREIGTETPPDDDQ